MLVTPCLVHAVPTDQKLELSWLILWDCTKQQHTSQDLLDCRCGSIIYGG